MNIETYILRMMDDIAKKYGNHKIDVTVTVPPSLFTYVETEVMQTWCHIPYPKPQMVLQLYRPNGTATIKPKEEPVNKPNAKEIANAIAEFPKDCQDKVTKLVEKLGFEVEKNPEPKAGQVWQVDGQVVLVVTKWPTMDITCTHIDGMYSMSTGSLSNKDLAEYLTTSGRYLAATPLEYFTRGWEKLG